MTREVFGQTNSNSFTVSTGSSAQTPPSDLFTQIDNIVNESKENVSAWQDKQDRYYRMRMRVKKPATPISKAICAP